MKRYVLVVLLLLAALSLAAPAGAQGKIANILFVQEPDNLNPMYTNMFFSGIARDLYLSGGWVFDEDLNPVPVLVTQIPSVENGGINADGTVITLTLRQDIVWSDGTPITAKDFLFTYEMITSEQNAPTTRVPYEQEIASVTAPDDYTVVVTFNAPYAPWLVSLFTFVLPEHVLRPIFEAEGTLDTAVWNASPTVGSGPFTFAEWEAGSHILFTRNDNYFGTKATLDGVFLRMVDDATQLAALQNNDGDLGTFMPLTDARLITDTNAAMSLVLVNGGYNESWYLNIRPDLGHPALQDVNVRKALVMAVDRDALSVDLNGGLTTQPASFWNGTPYARPDAAPLPYDPAAAAAMLDAAGWTDSNGDGTRDKDGVELVLRYIATTREIRVNTQAIVQQALAQVGIGTELINYESNQYFATFGEGGPLATGDFDIAQLSINPAFPDPDTSRFKCDQVPTVDSPDGANDSGICLPELDALFNQQAQTVDTTARIALFHQIDQILADQTVWVGLWTDQDAWIYSSRLLNLRLNGPNPFWNSYEWDLAS